MFAESLGYQVSDDNDGSFVTFLKPGDNIDNSIDWSRSQHETIVLNCASERTKADAKLIDEHMAPIIKHHKDEYIIHQIIKILPWMMKKDAHHNAKALLIAVRNGEITSGETYKLVKKLDN